MAAGTGVTERDDRVLPLTRGVAYAIIPFLLVAFAVLYPWPADTGRVFAWQIRPSLTAMILGSAYLGGAYYFLRAGRATAWHTVKGGLLPVAVFAGLLGVSTIVHWDKFRHDHVAFWLWVALYFTTPFLILFVYARNRRHDAPAADGDLLLPVAAARLIAAVGALALVTGAFLFLLPARAIPIWPWMLTPLTARVLGAVFCLGLAGLGVLADRRWSSARVPFQVAGVMLLAILIAGARAYRDFITSRPLTWVCVVGFVAVSVALAVFYRRMQRRARARGPAGPGDAAPPLRREAPLAGPDRQAPTAGSGDLTYATIEELVTRMRVDLAAMQEAGDARRFFHGTYLRTTEAVAAEIARGGFADGDWLRRWDLVFAALYLEALDADRAGGEVPAPWRVAFAAARERPDQPALRHVLFGINAHINYDLPQALLAVISTADFDDPELMRSRAADHQRLDTVLQDRVAAEDDELGAVSRVTLLDRLLRPANRAASRRFLTEAREKVWRNTIVLDQARRQDPGEYDAVLAELESLSAARVADLAAPGAVLLKLARRGFGVLLRPTP